MNILNNGRFGMAAALGGKMKYLVGRAVRYVTAQWASLLIEHEDTLSVLSVRHCDKCVVSGYVYVYRRQSYTQFDISISQPTLLEEVSA